MSKFKVGDKVIRTDISIDGVVHGGIYTVSSVDVYCSNSGHIRVNGSDSIYFQGYFELYEEPEADEAKVKPKFKVGDKVVVVNEGKTGEWASIGAIGYIIDCCTDDCTVEFISGNFKIHYGNTWCIAYDSLELLKEDIEVKKQKKQPHVHAELIKAWADGAEIEYYSVMGDKWLTAFDNNPSWMLTMQYRVKPEVKPDVTKVVILVSEDFRITSKVKLVFNPEMTEIKSADIIDVVSD